VTAAVPAGDGIGGLCDRLEEAHVGQYVWDALHRLADEWQACDRHEEADELLTLIAAARERDRLHAAVEGLAERLEVRVANRGRPAPGTYDHGVNRAQTDAAISLRSLLAAAAGETT
jgi:hypothetical protein